MARHCDGTMKADDDIRGAALGTAEMKSALMREIGEAVLALRSGELSDDAVHAVRKKLKRARAKLRLLRTAIDRRAYARENAALRDAARPLSNVRDSRVMLDAVEALLKHKGTRSRRMLLTALRGRLKTAHAQARTQLEAGRVAASSAAVLQRTSQRIAKWEVPRRGRKALTLSVRRVYRSARKALAAADENASPENLHELRKQVKYLREAVSALESDATRGAARIVKRADAVAGALGEDHDLYVLQEKLAATEASLHAHSAGFAEEIAEHRGNLEKQAFKRSRKLLSKKPRAFARRLMPACR